MALAAGDIVSPVLLISAPSVQGPIFGVVDDAAGIDVIWNNGIFAEGIALGTSLDKIGADPTTAATLVGRRVTVTSPAGQNNWGICVCVAVYTRQVNGANAISIIALLQNPTGEYFIEALASNCTALDN